MNIREIAEAIQKAEQSTAFSTGHSILLYGRPRTGKTRLGATLAKVPSIGTIHWFDFENGSDTIIAMYRDGILTAEQAAKIYLYKIKDTPQQAIAMDTANNCITEAKPQRLCIAHGRRVCPTCILVNKDFTDTKLWHPIFDLTKLTKKDWVVLDTGTQIGISIMAYLMKGMDLGAKPGWDEYGPQVRMLSDLCSQIQAASYCNFLFITHQLILDEKDKFVENKMIEKTSEEAQFGGIFPLLGTKNFSVNCAKFFGHIIYVEIGKGLKKHKAGSSSTYKDDVLTGSRSGIRIEDEKECDLSLVFDKLGLYPSSQGK